MNIYFKIAPVFQLALAINLFIVCRAKMTLLTVVPFMMAVMTILLMLLLSAKMKVKSLLM